MQKKVNHMMRCDAMMHTHTHKHKLLNNWITSQKCLPGLFIFSYQTYIRTHIWDVRECKLAFREFFFCSFHGEKNYPMHWIHSLKFLLLLFGLMFGQQQQPKNKIKIFIPDDSLNDCRFFSYSSSGSFLLFFLGTFTRINT